MGLARRVWPQGDPWRDWICVQNHAVGEKGGERHRSGPPLALGAPPVQTPKGANVGADPFPSSPENGLFIEKEKHKERKSARAFVLVFRLFASQLKSGRLGDSFAVFTV